MSALLVQQVHALTAESPLWDPGRGLVWYIDIQGQRLLGWGPADGRARSIPLPSMPGFAVPADDGGLILGLEDGLWGFDPETGALDHRVRVEADDPRTRLNEGKADAAGRLWFGTMDKTGPFGAIGALYRWDGTLTRLRTEVGVPNAINVTADGRTLLVADTRLRRIEAIALDPAGDWGAARVFAEWPEGEAPDGATLDAGGVLWVAVVGGGRIDRLAPDGTRLEPVPLPVSRPTCPAFGGNDLGTLFVTSQRRFLSAAALTAEPAAGGLLALAGRGTGRPAHAAMVGRP